MPKLTVKMKEGLQHQGKRNQDDMERITKDKFRLRGKNDDERQEEPHHGHMVKSRQKTDSK